MKTIVRLGLVVVALLWQQIVPSLAQSVDYRVYGLGARRCADFLADIKADANMSISYFSWAQGFMSHKNALTKMQGGGDINLAPDSYGIEKQFDTMMTFCNANSSRNFVDAVNVVYERLRRMSTVPTS